MFKEIIVGKTLGFTGHRPPEFGGYDNDDSEIVIKTKENISNIIREAYYDYGVTKFITGMALGLDTWAGLEVLKFQEEIDTLIANGNTDLSKIGLIAAIPFASQAKIWRNTKDVYTWKNIISKCYRIYVCEQEKYYSLSSFKELYEISNNTNNAAKYLFLRNLWMVDNSDYYCAAWNGKENGGTYNCVKYLQNKNIPFWHYNPNTFEVVKQKFEIKE